MVKILKTILIALITFLCLPFAIILGYCMILLLVFSPIIMLLILPVAVGIDILLSLFKIICNSFKKIAKKINNSKESCLTLLFKEYQNSIKKELKSNNNDNTINDNYRT